MNAVDFLRLAFPSSAVMAFLISVFPARAQDHRHVDGCILEQEHSVDPAVVAAMRKHGREKLSADALSLPAPAVQSVVGKTVAVVFYMEIDQGINIGPYWTPSVYSQVSDHIRRNCDWWEEIGRHYGREVELDVVEFAPGNPAALLHWDPTTTATPGEFIKDRSFYDTVMNRLGYPLGNSTEKMTAFCQDIAVANDADQAFIVWLIVGKNVVRSNASFNGPSTNVWYKSAQTGWTTAHEMGHIFGAFDEYYEEGTEYARSRQSRNLAPNGNLAYRNYPIVPCMMSASHPEGVCSYTAVHVGLVEDVRLTIVDTETPLGTYEVRYWNPDVGAFQTTVDRYQRAAQFPWGAGMRVLLTGLDSIADADFGVHKRIGWLQSAADTLDFVADTTNFDILALHYDPTQMTGDDSFEYLPSNRGGMGGYVRGIIPLGERRAAIASRDGISIVDDRPGKLRTVLDYPLANSRDGGPRRGFSVTIDQDSILWFGTQSSEIVRWDGDSASRLVGPTAGLDYRAVAATPDGDVWGGCDAGLHRFHNGRDTLITTYISSRNPLLGESVWSLAADGEGELWIGSRGRRDGGGGSGGLQRFDPATDSWTDFTGEIDGATVNSITIWGDTVAVATSNGFAIYDGGEWSRFEPGNDFHKTVMAVTRDGAGHLILSTFGGLYRRTSDETWERYTIENSPLPENLCTSAALGPDGTVWVGTVEGTIVLTRFNERSSSVAEPVTSTDDVSLEVGPNPAAEGVTASLRLAEAGRATLVLYDEIGRARLRAFDGDLHSGTHAFHVATGELERGVYWLELKTEKGTVTRGVVVE